MTTSIFTNLIEPFCELFYKYKKGVELQQANINTLRNYGFTTTYALNFGFEVYEPFSISDIKLQPGVFTYFSSYSALPTNLANSTTINVNNEIYLSDLPVSGIGTITYKNSTLPLTISIKQNGSSIIGIASNFGTNGIPYELSSSSDEQITRLYESDFANSETSTGLIFVYLEDATFRGTKTNWTIDPTSLYSYKINSFRYNNGFGQFGSFEANNSFVRVNLSTSPIIFSVLFSCTYMNVYNWANNLVWEPDFVSWYSLNKILIPPFIREFLSDYFDVN